MTMASVTWPNDENVCRSASVSVPLRSCNASLCEYVVPCERKARVRSERGGDDGVRWRGDASRDLCARGAQPSRARPQPPIEREGATRKGLTRTGFQRRS